MGADGKRLNQRRGFRLDVIHHQQIFYRHAEVLAKPAVPMYADHGNFLAAVCPAAQAGRTLTAGDVGYDGNLLSAFQIKNIFTQTDNLTAYFMTEHARIAKKRLIPSPGMNIRTTNPHRFYFNKHFIIAGNGNLAFFPAQYFGFLTH